MKIHGLAVVAIVSAVLSAALGLAGLIVAVATGGNVGALSTGFLSASTGFMCLAMVSVLLDLLGIFRSDGGTGRRRG